MFFTKMSMKRIQEICFLVNGFLLGSLAPLYGKTFNYFLLFMVLFHAVTQWNSFVKELRVGKKYIFDHGNHSISTRWKFILYDELCLGKTVAFILFIF